MDGLALKLDDGLILDEIDALGERDGLALELGDSDALALGETDALTDDDGL